MKKTHKIMFVHVLLICIFIMSACSTICPPDEGPRSGGYIGYKCYKEKWELELALLKSTYLELLHEKEIWLKEQQSLKVQKAKLSGLEEKVKKIDNIISQYNKGTREALLKKQQIERKISKLKQELARKPNQKEIDKKTREIKDLSNDLADLLEIVIDLY